MADWGIPASLSLDALKADAVAAGSALFSWTKAASATVATTAGNLKTQLEEKTILGDFEAEQKRWVEEQERGRELATASSGAGVAPWVGYPEESLLKKRILALSLDTRNFLRDPPGEQTGWDASSVAAVAAATLAEDPNLRKMRFHLVPKRVSEQRFWRNYFYRVGLVQQSAHLETEAAEEETHAAAVVAPPSPGQFTPVHSVHTSYTHCMTAELCWLRVIMLSK